jgi:hypothetical protein
MAYVRQCRRCSHVDERERFEREGAPEARVAHGAAWACPRCGSEDYHLVPDAPVGGG